MRGNSHVPFLGEEAMVTPPPYPTVRYAPASGSGSCPALAHRLHCIAIGKLKVT
jgi:hypothetical protein